MPELKSTIPGLVPFPGRNRILRTPYSYLESRRAVDGAEGLWRVGDGLYDLEKFVKFHPGGSEWIELTKGTDITELFESHHLTDKPAKVLSKYHIRDVVTPRSVSVTFKPDGFYKTFKGRALEALKDVDFHHPSTKSNMIADSVLLTTITLCLSAVSWQSYLLVLAAGISLAWTTIIAHNYFHMRDNIRMYYFDLSVMSSKEWRITHAMSHHIYPNTIWDYEMYVTEPMLNWLATKRKTKIGSFISQIMSPFYWSILFVGQLIKRYYSVIFEYKSFEYRDALPFLIPLLMCYYAPSVSLAVKYWFLIITVCSFVFSMIGFNAAHHHPDIFHDGDTCREDLDWGLLELDAVREREVIDDSDFLVLTNFGLHGLHHLLPTVDHSYLPLCMDAFQKTCKEFGVSTKKYTQWELMKGQFQQLERREPKKNQR